MNMEKITFREIKDSLIQRLSQLTIDDIGVCDDAIYDGWIFTKDEIQSFIENGGAKVDYEIYREEYKREHYDISNTISEEEQKQYDDEFDCLTFLCKILLKKDVKISDSYERGSKRRYLSFSTISNYDYSMAVVPYLKDVDADDMYGAPNDWREILLDIFQATRMWDGCIYADIIERINKTARDTKYPNFHTRSIPSIIKRSDYPSEVNMAANLALKKALKTNESLTNNFLARRIILELYGGVVAYITFRKKGIYVSRYQQKDIEMYVVAGCERYQRYIDKRKDSDNEFEYHNTYCPPLYTMPIQMPYMYYILHKEYVILIEFNTSPLLFSGTNTLLISKIASDIEEERIRREQEEEDARRNDDD
jgi:hypothetical protein